MEVTLVSCTTAPLDIISRAAGTSHGKIASSNRRARECFEKGHMSVFEHASVTFRIEGISRACSHQLVRHRLASIVQESQRYTKVEGDDWYVIPPYIEERVGLKHWYEVRMENSKFTYERFIKNGVALEDARYLLPEATKTNLTMTMNVRELFRFFDLRLDEHAQWEIRELGWKMVSVLEDLSEQWGELMDLYFGESED